MTTIVIEMAEKDYTTIKERRACETVIKGSRFIGVAIPIPDEDGLRSSLTDIIKEFPEATHYCYGAIYGGSNYVERSSDNGEPSGTAGRPILNVIRQMGLTDVVVIVIRYFGGTLLGTGGLTHAYSSSASSVLSMCEKLEKRMCGIVSVSILYQDYDRFNKYLLPLFYSKPDVSFDSNVNIKGPVPKDDVERFNEMLTETFGGKYKSNTEGCAYH